MWRLRIALITAALSCAMALAQPQARPGTEDGKQPEAYSVEVAARVLGELRGALGSRDRARTLSLFDADHMPDYQKFAASLELLFAAYQSIRVEYRILQTSDPGAEDRNAAIADFTLEAVPENGAAAVNHRRRLRFTFARGAQDLKGGWKISDIQPRDFFQGY